MKTVINNLYMVPKDLVSNMRNDVENISLIKILIVCGNDVNMKVVIHSPVMELNKDIKTESIVSNIRKVG